MNKTLNKLEAVLTLREADGITGLAVQYDAYDNGAVKKTYYYSITHEDLREMIAATRRDHDSAVRIEELTRELNKLECEYDELKAQTGQQLKRIETPFGDLEVRTEQFPPVGMRYVVTTTYERQLKR